MHNERNLLQDVAKQIIIAYTHHVRDSVRDGKRGYNDLGIDTSFDIYKGVFLKILGNVLGIKDDNVCIPDKLIEDELCLVIQSVINRTEFENLHTGYNSIIYASAVVIFEKVVTDLRDTNIG